MAASRGETRSHRRRLRGGALLVLAAALAPLLIGSQAQSDSALRALTTSNTALTAADGKSAEAAWPGLTNPDRPPPEFTDRFERPRSPTAQPLGVPAIAAHKALTSLASASVARAGGVTQVSPVTTRLLPARGRVSSARPSRRYRGRRPNTPGRTATGRSPRRCRRTW